MAKKIPFFDCRGDNYRIGYTIGRKTKKGMDFFLAKNLELFNNKELDRLSQKFLKISKIEYPQYLEELQGMADGSGQKFMDLFKFNLTLLERQLKDENCSTLVFKKKDRILIGHNEDLSENDVFLTRIRLNDGTNILAVCYYGILPGFSAALNSHGFVETMNFLASKDTQVGVPLTFLCRANIESRSIGEAVKRTIDAKRSKGENFIFYKGNNFVNLETTATKHVVFPERRYFAHTNHYLSKELVSYENKKNLFNSISRLVQARTLMDVYPGKNFRSLKKILSSHHDPPRTICRHIKKGGDDNRTAAAILIDTSKKEMRISYGAPCSSKFHKFKL
jgi:predicted choloylglycine hydrolase